MSLAEAPFNHAVNIDQPRWSPREAISRLCQLDGQTVDLSVVLQTHSPDHAHFGVDEIDKEPLALRPLILSACNKQRIYSFQQIDARQQKLKDAYEQYLRDKGIEGRANILLWNGYNLKSDLIFSEAIYPEWRGWQPEKVIELFPMVDFVADFQFSDTVRDAIKSSNDQLYKSILAIGHNPGVTINTTRVESTPDLYKIDILAGNKSANAEKIIEYLENSVPWLAICWDLGINRNIDALALSESGQQLVTSLLDARVDNKKN